MNTFGFLSSSEDPDQVVSNAANAAKNRRKREKRRQQKAAEETASAVPQPVNATQAANAGGQRSNRTLAQLSNELLQDAGSTDNWRTWDKWYREVWFPTEHQAAAPLAQTFAALIAVLWQIVRRITRAFECMKLCMMRLRCVWHVGHVSRSCEPCAPARELHATPRQEGTDLFSTTDHVHSLHYRVVTESLARLRGVRQRALARAKAAIDHEA